MAETILMPKLGLTMTEGTVDIWYKKEGDPVKKGEALCEISSEKLSQDVEAETDGVLLKILVPVGKEVSCKDPIGFVGQPGEALPSSVAEPEKVEQKTEEVATTSASPTKVTKVTEKTGRVFISPLAKKIAEEKGIDYTEIVGTGGNGRITRKDVEAYKAPAKETAMTQQVPTGEGLTGMRKAIAKNMMNSIHSSAQLSLHRKIDVTELMVFRKELKAKLGDSVSSSVFSLNIFLVKALAQALREVPLMNAHYDGQTYMKNEEINIGIAVALDEGLIVPVIKGAEKRSLSNLAKEFGRVTTAAKDGSLSGDDLSGGTFSMTNLGSEGIEYFTPILNAPEVGILGVGALSSRLVLGEDSELLEKKELPLSLTFDHQVVDGAPAAQFMKHLANYLEHPYLLMV